LWFFSRPASLLNEEVVVDLEVEEADQVEVLDQDLMDHLVKSLA
jgi:hypothetical protein